MYVIVLNEMQMVPKFQIIKLLCDIISNYIVKGSSMKYMYSVWALIPYWTY